MKQVLQNLGNGVTELFDSPCPQVKRGHLLIQSQRTLISAGTERMLVEFGKGNWLDKARSQPDKVRQVLEKIRTDGLLTTLEAVRNKLAVPIPLGYCNAGVVLEVGAGVSGFQVGDRVISNGPHAEIVCVPQNLCARIPAGVSDEQAAFTVLAAIGLQGVRLTQPTLGEAIVVSGLGLIGLLVVQMLRAAGCRVLGLDFSPARLAMAREFGAETVDLSKGEDPVAAGLAFSRGRGVDAVIITAATKSNEPVHQAALMCRQRGRIVLVGVVGLQLSRQDFYNKELSFQVSCSYGPGRYDPFYEEQGNDYPVGFVRWTEQRNFEAVLDLLASRQMSVDPLISHRYPFSEAVQAYGLLSSRTPSLGIVLEYPAPAPASEPSQVALRQRTLAVPALPGATARPPAGPVSLAVVGSGNYAASTMLPLLAKAPVRRQVLISRTGGTSASQARRFGFEQVSTDLAAALAEPAINTLLVMTPHNSHAELAAQGLLAGKHVFVEKPLAINAEQLAKVVSAYEASRTQGAPQVMVGFNRRFAPQVQRLRPLLAAVGEPKVLLMTVNAGAIPATHWTQDPLVGGGRIIGEGCHFVDLLRYLVGAPITRVTAHSLGRSPALTQRDDKATLTLEFADGSLGHVHYLANGSKAFPKERLEVFAAGRVAVLDNFRVLRGYGWPGLKTMKLWRQDKGHAACLNAFVAAMAAGQPAPIPFPELVEVAQACLEAARQLAAQ